MIFLCINYGVGVMVGHYHVTPTCLQLCITYLFDPAVGNPLERSYHTDLHSYLRTWCWYGVYWNCQNFYDNICMFSIWMNNKSLYIKIFLFRVFQIHKTFQLSKMKFPTPYFLVQRESQYISEFLILPSYFLTAYH